jgi:hypothetical protein
MATPSLQWSESAIKVGSRASNASYEFQEELITSDGFKYHMHPEVTRNLYGELFRDAFGEVSPFLNFSPGLSQLSLFSIEEDSTEISRFRA